MGKISLFLLTATDGLQFKLNPVVDKKQYLVKVCVYIARDVCYAHKYTRFFFHLQHAIGELKMLSLDDFEEKVYRLVHISQLFCYVHSFSLQYSVDFAKYRSLANLT